MESNTQDTYIGIQTRMMFFAYLAVSVMSIILMGLEAYNDRFNTSVLAQFISVASIFLGILYSLAAMLIVEVVYQDEIEHFPLIKYLARLTPELSLMQRHNFLSYISKRQITSTVSLMVFWIIFGETHRAAPMVYFMTMITMFTLYGIYYIRSFMPSPLPASDDRSK